MRPLTPAQKEVLDFLRSFVAKEGHPPTQAEIADALGYRSPNAAAQHLRLLEKKGALELRAGVARGIRLKDEPQAAALEGIKLPVVGEVAAGSPILADENVERELDLPRGLFRPRPHYLLRVRGESMIEAGIRPGDLVAVQRKAEVRDGQLAIIRIDDEVTLKTWRRQGKKVRLEPANAAFEPIVIDPRRDQVEVEGLVIGLLRLSMKGI